jgi:radical SAM protein with 4Fe4S-binding SPASM domain
MDVKSLPRSGLISLKENLPLDTPLSVHIDPTNGCNFKCSFCPTGDPALLKEKGRKVANLKLTEFQKIIDDMKDFPRPVKSLLLYKDGEPLLCRDLGRMIKYAKQCEVAETIAVTTNASLLTLDRSIELIDAGLDAIRISVEHVSDDGYKNVTRTFANYETIVNNVALLYAEKTKRQSSINVHAKIVDVGLSDQEKKKFMSDFSPITDSTNIDTIMGWSNNTDRDWTLAQSVSTAMDGITQIKKSRKVCPSPFKTLAVNSNGNVSLCCVDWSHETSIGNAFETPLADLWNSPQLREFRLQHLRGNRCDINVCSQCQYIEGMPGSSDLDSDVDRLVECFSE